MTTIKKCGSSKTRKPGCPKVKIPKLSETMMQDFVQHKTSVLVIMTGALSLGALFAMMLGVSAANF
ncbi:MAG: hypothetical protein WC750_01280 [Patescibacteria group bacterium]|jgi:hypothetical protein